MFCFFQQLTNKNYKLSENLQKVINKERELKFKYSYERQQNDKLQIKNIRYQSENERLIIENNELKLVKFLFG